jgi:hypothetical protein
MMPDDAHRPLETAAIGGPLRIRQARKSFDKGRKLG